MDDVLLMADNEKDLQDMLDITMRISEKYHIVFGEEKSKVMIMKKNPQLQTQLKLGEMKIKTTENYKYLGEIINHKKTTKNQIDEAKRKAEGALQTILTIAGDPILRGIQMETIWKLIDTCIIPIITYDSELWNPNKKETKQIDQVLDNIIKRILMVPTSTPREATYIETGLKDMESNRTQKRINMMNRIEKNKNNLISTITDIDNNQNWKNITIQTMEKIGLTTDELKKLTTKHQQKKRVTEVIERDFKNRMNSAGNSKSKVKHLLEGINNWKVGTRPKYMNQLNRFQVSTIFKARTRMLDIKNNFRGKYNNLTCRGCGEVNETQEHVLNECKSIHQNENTRVEQKDIFSNNITTLTKTAESIDDIMEIIRKSEVLPLNGAQPGYLGDRST